MYGFFVHVDGDVVNGMAAYQPVVSVCILCGVYTPAQQADIPPYH